MTPKQCAESFIENFAPKRVGGSAMYQYLIDKFTKYGQYMYNKGYEAGRERKEKVWQKGYNEGLLLNPKVKEANRKFRVTNKKLAKAFNINVGTLEYRLARWPIKKSLLTPVNHEMYSKNKQHPIDLEFME